MPTEPAMTIMRTRKISCIVITHAGLEIALRLRAAFDIQLDIYVSARVAQHLATQERLAGIHIAKNVAAALQDCWHDSDQIILCLALGAVVRLIAPFLQDKHLDPGVVVVDDAATFVISLLSGHAGGANAFADNLAHILHALPVVTTASEVHGTVAIDLLGRDQHWWLEPASDLTGVAAAIVNGERVALLQEAGDRAWWRQYAERKTNLTYHTDRHMHQAQDTFAAQVLITDRTVGDMMPSNLPTVLYRPRTLVLGIGCRRGVAFADLEDFVQTALLRHGLSIESVSTLATADIKGDEPAILELVQRYDWTLETHTVAALKLVKDIPSPSDRVLQLIGTPSVSEASALLSAGYGELLVCKQKGVGMTIAIARRSLFGDHSGKGHERNEG